MAAVYDEVLARGMFSWQQMWNGQGSPSEKNGCCTSPLVRPGATCATTLRALCTKDSPAQTRAMTYAFSPGGCKGDPGNLTYPEQDIANFLLVRGPYAWLVRVATARVLTRRATCDALTLSSPNPSQTMEISSSPSRSSASTSRPSPRG